MPDFLTPKTIRAGGTLIRLLHAKPRAASSLWADEAIRHEDAIRHRMSLSAKPDYRPAASRLRQLPRISPLAIQEFLVRFVVVHKTPCLRIPLQTPS